MIGKELRNSILQWAIQGRLVPQDPCDEPASVLLRRINPKAKPITEEVPFPLPPGWTATPMSMLCELTDGEKIKGEELINLDAKYLRGQDKGKTLKEGRFIPANSLVILVDGENSGEVFRTPIDGYQGSTFKMLVINPNMDEDFMLLVINTYRIKLRENKVGSAIPHLNKKLFKELPVPLPPREEQGRIVKKVEALLEVVARYERAQLSLCSLNDGLRGKLRASILQEAITGRLVPQDPCDEPASVLLRRLNPKAKPITEEVSFPIPDSWCWCKLGEIFSHNTGKALNKSVDKSGLLLPYITTSNVYWDKLDLSEVRKMYFKESEIEKCTIRKGDLLVCEGGDFGRSAIWNYEETICIQNHIHRLRAKGNVVSHRFYLYVMMLYKDRQLIQGKGIGLMGLSSRTLDNLLVPLPPVGEQGRIVAKVEALFAVLARLPLP